MKKRVYTESELATIRLFPHYRDFNPDFFDDVGVVKPIDKGENDEIYHLIFAPDPQTGVPRSDMAFIYSKDSNPQLAQFIQSTLQRPLPDSVGSEDPDIVLNTIHNRGETLAAYADRLRSYCSSNSD